MRVLFFSTSSNVFDGSLSRVQLPPNQLHWERLAERFPDDEFIVATQKPGTFLLDVCGGAVVSKSVPGVRFELVEPDDEGLIADFLASFAPDVAVAATFYAAPLDWLPVKDALVAERLRALGVRTMCAPLETAVCCFDKWRTRQALERLGFPVARAVYVHHELFVNGGNRRGVRSNVYRSSVIAQIEALRFPVVVKDTVGLSSLGTDVLGGASEVREFLKSRRFTSDRVVEEYVPGPQLGCEICGSDGAYDVLPPFLFSVNRYGITSPRQGVKVGPVTGGRFPLEELSSELLRLARCLSLSGVAQVDLVFREETRTWHILEINPRLSGMTAAYAAMRGMSVFETLAALALGQPAGEARARGGLVMSAKFPLLPGRTLSGLSAFPFVASVHQVENRAARQVRERGYCEVVLTGGTRRELLGNLRSLTGAARADAEGRLARAAEELLLLV